MNRETIAKLAYTINRIYRGDESSHAWENASKQEQESVLRSVDAHLANPDPNTDDDPFGAVIQALKDSDQKSASQSRPFDVPVRYIGRRDTFTDTLYSTGLSFAKDQVRRLPPEIASKFLRHQDLFRRDDSQTAGEAPQNTEHNDDTAEVLEKSRAKQKKARDDENQLLDVIDQVNQMTKAGLAKFAYDNFKHEFKSDTKVGEMRAETVQMIHQYGLP